ncbi:MULTISPECIES: YdeI/OmpD-associated family protein [Phenylobacterium]|uniref:Uncharacterized protein YdeI (YjbR/CyaY-like superfamily) n=1 Tax=Phenylobacterium koreense TaxID=266125 RepID=A0ABV2EHC9_9CAUL
MTLKRALNPMPDAVLEALLKRNLLGAFEARPSFQRNDYLGWIARARKDETRRKRLDQMLDELEDGDIYMKMRWSRRADR